MLSLRLAQIEVEPGQPEVNAQSIEQAIAAAVRDRVDILALPELCVPGYLIGDAWERPAFLRECAVINARLIQATAGTDLILIFGSVVSDDSQRGEDGRWRRYNAYIVAQNGQALAHPALGTPFGIKTLLPNYREFDDARYFYDGRRLALERGQAWDALLAPYQLKVRGIDTRLGILLCEDSWDDDYAQRPLAALATQGSDLILNLSASPFTAGKNAKRHRLFAKKTRNHKLPLAYVNCVGLQNNGKNFFTFDGHSSAYDTSGNLLAEAAGFAPAQLDLRFAPESRQLLPSVPQSPQTAASEIDAVGTALRYALGKILKLFGLKRVVIGLSGGIDSAVAAALYASVLPADALLLANLPSRYNSPTTIGLAKTIASRLGCYYTSLSIEDSVTLTRQQIDGLKLSNDSGLPALELKLSGLALENIQARDRSGRLLAALAAAFGGAFTCNANKAETTVGYATLYGDHGGFLAALGDLWKEQIYALGHWLNTTIYGREVLPSGVFSITPSAELSAAHAVDEGKGDPLIYPYHDRLFCSWVQRWQRSTPEELLQWYADGSLNRELDLKDDAYQLFTDARAFVADLERWWELYCGMGAVKRVQSPPNIVVSSRAFGYDHREHLGPAFYSAAYRRLRAQLLQTT